MGRYALRRCLLAIPTLILLSLFTFSLSHLAPGDPVQDFIRNQIAQGESPSPAEIAHEKHALGLDQPFLVQYVKWATRAAHGDLGRSYKTSRPISVEFAERFPVTARLAIPAGILALALALPIAIASALYRNRWADQLLRILALAGASMPSFWLALLLIYLFAVHLHMFPVAGEHGAHSMVLPVVTLALGSAAVMARFARSELIEALGEDYARTAAAKGLAPRMVLERHALRNALGPLANIFGSVVGRLLVGTVIVETIFAWPGLGSLLLDAINNHDYPVIEGLILYTGVVFVAVNVIVDLAHAMIDPRVRLGERRGTAS